MALAKILTIRIQDGTERTRIFAHLSGFSRICLDHQCRSEPYELSANVFSGVEPAYIRGQAYLQLADGRSAAKEFQKLLDHRGLVSRNVIGALSYLQIARAQKLMGDDAAARKSYEDFLNLWKDADPDIPIYQAKSEYASLLSNRAAR